MNLYLKSRSFTLSAIFCCCLSTPLLISGVPVDKNPAKAEKHILYIPADLVVTRTKTSVVAEEARLMYEDLKLNRTGLSRKVFEYAWKGYKHLLSKGQVRNREVLSICDFSLSSRRKRLFVIDLQSKKLLVNTYVAHGRNSGGEYASRFSNSPESHQSSLGFYVTRNTYFGEHGLALKIDGMERGINDKANERNIVVHGSNYVGEKFIRNNPFNGRSFGCPAIPSNYTPKVINSIKDGSCLFIYHPTKYYLSRSRILNG
ncbi:murein L,D-transpeptidase catalytic domain family protein [Flavitalea sp.]|nr:murein L,D-transpeptidase catalytic domain family protein [Flavitalea sp.]